MTDPTPVSALSDGTILRLVEQGRIKVTPWDRTMVQPASIDLRLGPSFRVFHNHHVSSIDLRQPPPNLTEEVVIGEGETFVIHPGEFCLGTTLEVVELPDDIVARIEGKALALDTEVPTPDGFRTMGELEPGDRVFSPTGAPTRVVAATESLHGRDCFEVRFSDGTNVLADGEHQWIVSTNYDRKRGTHRVLTTREMLGRLRAGNGYAYRVDQARPVQHTHNDLPIDPYVFGAWVGDGTSKAAVITSADQEILDQFVFGGESVERANGRYAYRVGGTGATRDPATGQYERNGSLSSRLRDLGVLGDKHIPEEYLTGSVSQRMALLEGLMDTDGYVDTLGRCDLTTVREPLALQYFELIASLGFRPTIAAKPARLYGKDCGTRYEVTFTPHAQVFRLSRKAQQLRLTQRLNFGRSIIEIVPRPSVPVRCIEVEDPSGAFLITRAHIPTHNSSLGRLGLIVHATAGFCDPGWKGQLTLELNNLMRVPIELSPGLPIAQLSFMTLDRAAERPYGHPELGSHYHGQSGATESRYEGGPGSDRVD